MRISNLLFGLLLIGGGLIAKNDGEFRKELIAHFSLDVPNEYILMDVSPQMADFYMLQVSKDGDPAKALKIFIGNCPSFPVFKWQVEPKEKKMKGGKSTCFSYDSRSGLMEGLLKFKGLTDEIGIPSAFTCIHFFAGPIDPESAAKYEAIVESIKVSKPSLK